MGDRVLLACLLALIVGVQSRRVDAARTTAAEVYHVAGLPLGHDLAVAVEDVEEGEWLDPGFLMGIRSLAVKLTLGEGE